MLDRYTIKVIRWPLRTFSALPDKLGITANQITLAGFVLGLLALPSLILQEYLWALSFILLNRIFDGLDGAVARRQGISDCGGFFWILPSISYFTQWCHLGLCSPIPKPMRLPVPS